METKNGLRLISGRANSLECAHKDKGGFDFSFNLEGRNFEIKALQTPSLPLKSGDEISVVCDKKGRVLGLKNRSLKSAVWYAYEPSLFFAVLFLALFSLFVAAAVWAIFSGYGQGLLGTLMLVFGFGSLAFAWFKFHREAFLGLCVRSPLGAVKEPAANGEASGTVRELRIFEAKDKNYFSAAIGDTFLRGASPKNRALELDDGDEASVKYENFRVVKIRNLSKNLTAKKSQGFFERALRFSADVIIGAFAGFISLYLGTKDFWFSPVAGIAERGRI